MTIAAVHQHASGNFADTETTVHVNGNRVRTVTRCLPGLQWWVCPDAATIREWVDNALLGTGLKRDGQRIYLTGGSITTWSYTYPLKEA